MKYEITKSKKVEIYGRAAKEIYTFKFTEDGFSHVRRKVKIDKDHSGYITDVAIETETIQLLEVPTEVREEVSDILIRGAEDI